MANRFRIGIDLGGTKIEGIVLAPDGSIAERRRLPTPRDYAGTLDALVELVHVLDNDVVAAMPDRETTGLAPGNRATIGIGIPGAVSAATGLVKNANSTWLIGRPLGRDLEIRLERQVRLMNDANCFAISEAADGAAAGANVVFGVILGTGVGGGIVMYARALEGANRIAGEWGHNPLPGMDASEAPGPSCYCGRNGCIETFLSGPAFEAEYRTTSGESRPAADIAKLAATGNPSASAALDRYHERLARALGSVVNVLDPDVIVLGGGMSNLPGLAESVGALLPRFVFSDNVSTRVVRHVHGDSSGVRGAAWLWPLTE